MHRPQTENWRDNLVDNILIAFSKQKRVKHLFEIMYFFPIKLSIFQVMACRLPDANNKPAWWPYTRQQAVIC